MLGGEEGRTSGWLAADTSRRHVSGLAASAGSLSKQKNPVGNESTSNKEAMVSLVLYSVVGPELRPKKKKLESILETGPHK